MEAQNQLYKDSLLCMWMTLAIENCELTVQIIYRRQAWIWLADAVKEIFIQVIASFWGEYREWLEATTNYAAKQCHIENNY